METKTLEKLEFNKIKDNLSNYAVTNIGQDLAKNLMPLNKYQDIIKAQKQTTESLILLFRKGQIPIDEIAIITGHIKKLESSNTLSIKELLDLSKILSISNSLKDYFFSSEIDMSEFTNLENLFTNLYTNPGIEKEIKNAIIDENTISDDASSTLKQIRKDIFHKEQEIKSKLNSIIHSKYVQESVITLRQGRFVVPVKNEYQKDVKGFVHDISQSGSTIFIEPISVFDLNNDLNNLKNDEQIEIEKILQKLSNLFFEIIDKIQNDVNLIGLIDFIFAKAKYSKSLNASEPIITEKEKVVNLFNCYHPLIDEKHAVKNDIIIGKEYNSLIITGPNTGGKTVTLKTAGLLTIMALSGLHITAKESSKIYLFDEVFADIGDEQSIQDSLSTFSSHMTNIAHILDVATKNSFILLDELGSGTDPVEGASLAISILEKLHFQDSITLATTHYPELKHYALLNDGFENASVEFNIDTLSPTYKLLLGVPGTSNAFSISKKLGISEDIISRAKEFIESDELSIEELLTNIYENKKIIEEEKEKTVTNSKKIEKLKESLEQDLNNSKQKQKDIIDKAKDQARDILINAKEDANSIIKELEESKDTKKSNKLRDNLNQKISDLSISNNKDVASSKKVLNITDLKPNMTIFITKFNQEGTILSISKDNKIQVQLPLGKMFFEIDDLELIKTSNTQKQKSVPKKDYSKNKEFKASSISSEINVIGLNVDEACPLIDKYLDSCALSSLLTIRIVHGKGTGALRKGIHSFLKTHPHVKSYRVGTFGEGEMGVTIVELK